MGDQRTVFGGCGGDAAGGFVRGGGAGSELSGGEREVPDGIAVAAGKGAGEAQQLSAVCQRILHHQGLFAGVGAGEGERARVHIGQQRADLAAGDGNGALRF